MVSMSDSECAVRLEIRAAHLKSCSKADGDEGVYQLILVVRTNLIGKTSV